MERHLVFQSAASPISLLPIKTPKHFKITILERGLVFQSAASPISLLPIKTPSHFKITILERGLVFQSAASPISLLPIKTPSHFKITILERGLVFQSAASPISLLPIKTPSHFKTTILEWSGFPECCKPNINTITMSINGAYVSESVVTCNLYVHCVLQSTRILQILNVLLIDRCAPGPTHGGILLTITLKKYCITWYITRYIAKNVSYCFVQYGTINALLFLFLLFFFF